MVLILLKAMTVIPMAIGILKIKAFNALALGFFSFIVSVGLAIFQLCKKVSLIGHFPIFLCVNSRLSWDVNYIGMMYCPKIRKNSKINTFIKNIYLYRKKLSQNRGQTI